MSEKITYKRRENEILPGPNKLDLVDMGISFPFLSLLDQVHPGEQEALDELVELGWCDACNKRTYTPQYLRDLVICELDGGFDHEYLAWCPWCHRAISHEMGNEGDFTVRWVRSCSFRGYAGLLVAKTVQYVTSWLMPSHNWTVLTKWSIDKRMHEARLALAWYWKIKEEPTFVWSTDGMAELQLFPIGDRFPWYSPRI